MKARLPRRDLLKMALLGLGGAILAACGRRVKPPPTDPPTATATGTPTPARASVVAHTKPIPWGYYLLQQVATYHTSRFGAISTASEAEAICRILMKHPVSGVEYGPIYFHSEDISACVSVADVFSKHGIDLWLTSAALQKLVPAFNNDAFPAQYRAYSMTPDGAIVPASVWSLGSPEKGPAFDSLNSEAMKWFISRYRDRYLEPLAQYTSGYFFNEDCLYYASEPGHPNNNRIDYWELPAYSDVCLQLWQEYCQQHSVTYNGTVVSKFPVHSESLVPNGAGKTDWYPGYNVPPTVQGGTSLVSIPRNTGVWAAWDEFVTSQYVNSWIGSISDAVYEVNGANPIFKGVLYFGLHNWSLGYEEVVDPTFSVDTIHQWVPWGTQRGVRLAKICALPSIDHIVCETYPPIRARLYNFASTYKQIIAENDRAFGLMLHRDDDWGLDGKDPEVKRWEMIESLQPTIIARYPIDRLFPTDQYYDEQKEALFDERLVAYRE